jgi:ABC-type methionine transport system ATPase subunit
VICLIEITYDANAVQKPLICNMSKRFDVCFNIYKAEVNELRAGTLVLEIEGDSREVHSAVEYLEDEGVTVSYIDSQIALDYVISSRRECL